MKIIFVRHGETTGDVENLFGGDYDDHLTEKGIQQAHELAEKMTDRGIEKIFSSPRHRAIETAGVLHETLGVEVEVIEDMRERNNYGFLTGTSKDEAKIKYPEIVEQLKDWRTTIKGAEDYDHFTERVTKALEYASNSPHDTIAIVTHGQVTRCIVRSIVKAGELPDELPHSIVVELEKTDQGFKIVQIEGTEIVGA